MIDHLQVSLVLSCSLVFCFDRQCPLESSLLTHFTLFAVQTKKGQRVFVPVNALNWSTEIWGEDALKFVPERWAKDAPAAVKIPTVYAGLATFGAGARACIGFRMAGLEMKVSVFWTQCSSEPELTRTYIVVFTTGPAVPCSGTFRYRT